MYVSEVGDSGSSAYERLIGADRVSGRLYTDPAVFEREMERIHHRGWMFVGHESEVAAPGEFVTRRLGRQPEIPPPQRGRGQPMAPVQLHRFRRRYRQTRSRE